jgi:hypothetical protein
MWGIVGLLAIAALGACGGKVLEASDADAGRHDATVTPTPLPPSPTASASPAPSPAPCPARPDGGAGDAGTLACNPTAPFPSSPADAPIVGPLPALIAQPNCAYAVQLTVEASGPTVCTFARDALGNILEPRQAQGQRGTERVVGDFLESCITALPVATDLAFDIDVARCPTAGGSGSLRIRFDADGGAPTRYAFAGGFDTGTGSGRCASPDTLVATPTGDRAMDTLAVGDLVYSVEENAFVAVPVDDVRRVPVRNHRVVRLELASGAVIEMSPRHPLPGGGTFADLAGRSAIDGIAIRRVTTVDFTHPYTMDIRPRSRSGTYVAGGIAVGSTLAPGDARKE